MFKVNEFSGVFFAVPVVGAELETVGEGGNNVLTNKPVQAIRLLQERLSEFNRKHLVGIVLGIGLNRGSVYMGLLGSDRIAFDVVGRTRDMTYCMADYSHKGGIVLPVRFESQLKPVGELVSSEVTITLRNAVLPAVHLLPSSSDSGAATGLQLSDFEHICMLGVGGYGSVHLAQERRGRRQQYAIKILPRSEESSTHTHKLLQREFSILQQIDHPNVVNFVCSLMNKTRVYLVMEYIRGGNLHQVILRMKETNMYVLCFTSPIVILPLYLIYYYFRNAAN